MLFHNDVMAHRKAKPGAFACWFGREKGIEYLLFDLRRDAGAIVADANFDPVTEILRRGGQRRFKAVSSFYLAFVCCVESV